MSLPDPRSRAVPGRALALSIAALVVPVVGALGFSEQLGEYSALLWLVTLIPGFLLAYYKGWRGVALALALGMAALSLTQAVASWMVLPVPETLLGVVIAYLAISMGLGLLAEGFHRERDVVEDMAFTDLLTRLPNRRHALLFLENEFAAAQRGRLLSVIVFDLDGFKAYNDTHGHQAGDEAIRAFADVLARTTRRMNLSARFGGEEYISILAGSDAEGSLVFAERVRSALEAQKLGSPPLTVSGGVAMYESGMNTPDDLVAAADSALYQAKRNGRNQIRLFTGSFEDAPGLMQTRPDGRRVHTGVEQPAELSTNRNPDPALAPGGEGELGRGRSVHLVEEDPMAREIISSFLRSEGFEVSVSDSLIAAERELETEYDVVVAELRLETDEGRRVVSQVKTRWPATQVVAISGIQGAQAAGDALTAGADRYLFKPFGMADLRSHLVDALARREQLRAAAYADEPGEDAAPLQENQARESVLRGAMALVTAAEVRDPYTRGHSMRVGAYSAVLADQLDPDESQIDRELLQLACELHDVGKIGIPDAILNKESTLAEGEFDLIRQHPVEGRRILEPLVEDDLILSVTQWHHERWDGGGSPDGLAGEEIPRVARLVAVADTLDAMTCPRAYRHAIPWEEALGKLREDRGTGFDPEMIDLIDGCLPELKRIHTIAEESMALPAPGGSE